MKGNNNINNLKNYIIEKKKKKYDMKEEKKGGIFMKNVSTKWKEKGFKLLAGVAMNMATKTANGECMLIYHQPEKPEELKKLRRV